MQQKNVLYLVLVSVLLIGCGKANNSDSKSESSASESAKLNSEKPDSDPLDAAQPDAEASENTDAEQANSTDPNIEQPEPKSADVDKTINEKPQPNKPNSDPSNTANSASTDASSISSDSKSRATNFDSSVGVPGRPINITFDDVQLDIKEDVVFQDSMLTDRVRDLEGKYIRIRGFICAEATFKQKDIKQFILIKNNQCKFGPGGQFHHNMAVSLRPEDAIDFTTRAVTVEGKLKLKPMTGPNGKTWTLYHLEG